VILGYPRGSVVDDTFRRFICFRKGLYAVMKIGLLFAFMPIFLSSYLVRGQSLAQVENMQKAPLCYGIMKINDPLTIDGLDEEEAWSKAPWTAEFVDIEGDLSSKP